MGEPPELLVADAAAWRRWLDEHHDTTPGGVWLVLRRPGAAAPTRLAYAEALDEALCQGWIDGGLRKRDDATHRVRFTPRRSRGPWSRRNVQNAERLVAEGRMRPAGLAEVERARADGRWERAYGGAPGGAGAVGGAPPHPPPRSRGPGGRGPRARDPGPQDPSVRGDAGAR